MNIPIIRYRTDSLDKVYSRSQIDDEQIIAIVKSIIKDVRTRGDEAVFEYTKRYDNLDIDNKSVKVTEEEIEEAYKKVDIKLLSALKRAKENVLNYHLNQIIQSDLSGKTGWIMRPMATAGIYIPGGTAPYPSSVLMCALPAIAAGVKDIVMVTPNPRNPLTLAAAKECGIKDIYKVGGAQAIAALAYGTKSIPKVDIIAGPGNVYVTLAKKEVFGNVAIDMLAGPSEILVIADDTANSEYIIYDMLSQAEHGGMSAAILITTSDRIAKEVSENILARANTLTRREHAIASLQENCAIIKVNTLDEAVMISDKIAPEHLELCVSKPREIINNISNAGAIFIGNYSPEPLGDYYAGPSHVLPTSGGAKCFSVLSTSTFMKRISCIEYNKEDLMTAAEDIIMLAECEGLQAHALSISVRKE